MRHAEQAGHGDDLPLVLGQAQQGALQHPGVLGPHRRLARGRQGPQALRQPQVLGDRRRHAPLLPAAALLRTVVALPIDQLVARRPPQPRAEGRQVGELLAGQRGQQVADHRLRDVGHRFAAAQRAEMHGQEETQLRQHRGQQLRAGVRHTGAGLLEQAVDGGRVGHGSRTGRVYRMPVRNQAVTRCPGLRPGSGAHSLSGSRSALTMQGIHAEGPEGVGDGIDELLDQVLTAPEGTWPAALEDLCRAHPERASDLRRRFSYLERCGLVDGSGDAAGGAAAPARPEQGRRFGPFELGPVLGHGAMGVVFRAVDRTTGATRAVKVIRPELVDDPAARRRFLHEGELAARVQHRNLCRVHGVGEVDGTPYLAMDLLEGETLASRLERARRHGKALAHGWPGLVALFEQVARALGAAHAAGLVHRDVKPGNLMIDAAGRPVLFDFGLALSTAGTRLTRTGSALGTPAYMPPEQVRGGETITAHADVYALGASLYEALALRPPFGLLDREVLYRRILHDEPDDLRRLVPQVPRALAWVVHRCLEKSPARRYADANELADDLQRVRQGEPTRARPPGALRRLLRRTRRHPVAASLTLAATIAVVSLSLLAWQERQRADLEAALTVLSAEQLTSHNATQAALLARDIFAQRPTPATRTTLLAALQRLHQIDEVASGRSLVWSAGLADGRLVCVGLAGTGAADPPATGGAKWMPLPALAGNSGAASDDGRRLAVVDETTHAPRLFADDGTELPLAIGEPVPVGISGVLDPAIAFAGDRLHVGDRQGRISVYDARGSLAARWRPNGDSCILSLWTLRDGRVLTIDAKVAGSRRLHEVRVSSAGDPDGIRIFTAAPEDDEILDATALSADGRVLFLALRRHYLRSSRIVRIAVDGSGAAAVALPSHRHWVTALAADATGDHAIVGTGGHLMVFLLEQDATGAFGLHPVGATESTPTAATFGPARAGRPACFAVGGFSGMIRVHTMPDGQEVAALIAHGHAVSHLRFQADGAELVSVSRDERAVRWRLELPGLPMAWLPGPVSGVGWLPDGAHFVAGCRTGDLTLCDQDGRHVGTQVVRQGREVRLAVAHRGHPLAPEATVVAAGGDAIPLGFWACQPAAREPLRQLPIASDDVRPAAMAFAADGSLLAGDADGVLHLLGPDGRRSWREPEAGSGPDAVTGVAVGPGGTVLAAARGRQVRWWRRPSGQPVAEPEPGGAPHELAAGVTTLVFPPDDDRELLVGLDDGDVLWLELATGRRRPVGRHANGTIHSLAVSPDGRLVLSGGRDARARIWTRDGEPVVALHHASVVLAAAFAPDSRRVLTGVFERTARVSPLTDDELARLARELPFRDLRPGESERRRGRW